MSRGIQRAVLYMYLGVAGAWLAYTAYLGFTYDMFPDVAIGAVKILVAATAAAGLVFVAIRRVFRRSGRSSRFRRRSTIARMRHIPARHT